MSEINRRWLLAQRPAGMVDESCFRWAEEPAPDAVEEGQILVRNLVLSLDPTQRGWMSRDTYLPAIKIGEVMRSGAAARVVKSRHPGYAEGDLVAGMFGWQDYAVASGGGKVPPTKVPPGVPLELAMSTLGLTGITAYFGLLEVGRPVSGETVVVTGAAGATGSVVGQIARIKGCRAIGIAGGKDKCEWVLKEGRFAAAIDYKSEDVPARLRELCPSGIDVYFDNVGGDLLDVALAQLAMHGRIVLCGAIATYNDSDLRPGPKQLPEPAGQARPHGGLPRARLPAARRRGRDAAVAWVRAGEIKDRVDVMQGLENAPKALQRLFTGDNQGKQLLRIAD